MTDHPSRVTVLLREWQGGDARAGADLAAAVYDELRRLAASRLRLERGNHTLQATALVNEAWLKLVDQRSGWQNRGHFFALAAQAMRRILVDHARRRHSAKRGRDPDMVPVDDVLDLLPSPLPDERLIAVDEALTQLAVLDPRQAQVVELRFFAGLSVADVAQVLDVSPTTVKREWASARAWLFDAIEAPRE
ncbi:MAG: sigma-70 family RNA polymerase sigma factor [Acidobacteriota bacterium]